MIKVYNDIISVTKDDPVFFPLKLALQYTTPERTVYTKGRKIKLNAKVDKLYSIEDSVMYIPAGIFEYLKDQLNDYEDLRTTESKLFNTSEIIDNIENYSDILEGITLRIDQLLACRKILYTHRCLIQAPTGCLRGDTKIYLVSGKVISIEDLYNQGCSNESVFCCTTNGLISIALIDSIILTRSERNLVEISFEDGVVACTKDHPFLLKNGVYKSAIDLKPCDELMRYEDYNNYKKMSVNHRIGKKIKSIKLVTYDEPVNVYDIQLNNELHNFAIQVGEGSGVFVHNSGKSEIMCAATKFIALANDNKLPTTLVLEPTIRLVNDTVKRFEKYDIKAVKYSDNRKIIPNCVNVCHPKSLGNDLDKDNNLLEEVEVMFGDECHHLKSDSWRKPTYRMPNLMYSVGISASAISQDHVDNKDVRDFTYDELLTLGATGPIVMNIKAGSLINQGKLATPVLLMVDNPANEPINEKDVADWHKVVNIKLKSDNRISLVAKSAMFFEEHNRKSLILVSTIEWSQLILKKLYELGCTTAMASYGGGRFEQYNGNEYIQLDEDSMVKFEKGECMTLIGTSHLYEGVDIPNLDTIILAYGGKGERMQIQGLGRALRKTKSGNMAYIVDFTDSEDVVLRKHSKLRMQRYEELIGIPNDRIYYEISIEDFEGIFNKYEN